MLSMTPPSEFTQRTQGWTDLHQAVWDGRWRDLRRGLEGGLEGDRGPSLMLLAMERDALSYAQAAVVAVLLRAGRGKDRATWGQPQWGGGLSLLDRAVSLNWPSVVRRQGSLGLTERTFRIADLQADGATWAALAETVDVGPHLPAEDERWPAVEAALARRRSRALSRNTDRGSGGEGRRERL